VSLLNLDAGALNPPNQRQICFDTWDATGGYSTNGYLPRCDTFAIADGTTISYVVQLDPAGGISGTVTGTDGKLVPGGSVQAYSLDPPPNTWLDGSLSAVPDSNGAYHLRGLPPGRYALCVRPGNSINDTSTGYLSTCTGYASPPTGSVIVDVSTGSTTQFDATVQLGGTISGTVTTATGGAPGRWMYINVYTDNGAPVSNGGANADGTYSIGGLPTGNYQVCFGDTNPQACYQDPVTGSRTAAVTAGAITAGIDVTLPAG
jgi:hypothetical protein